MSTPLPAAADRSGGASSVAAAASISPTKRAKPYFHAPGILAGLPWTARLVRNLKLRAHCRMMGRAHAARSTLGNGVAFGVFARLCEIAERRSRILTELHPNVLPAVPAFFRMAGYHAQMVREPEAWDPDPVASALEQWESLVSHLFEKWPVARAFAKAWFTIGPVEHIERDWFCHVGGGGSLRRLPGMRPLTPGAARELPNAPIELSASGAVRHAQLKALKCPEELAGIVMRSSMAADFSHDDVWLPLVQKFIAARGVEPVEFGVVADGFRYLLSGGETERLRELLRQPLQNVVRHWQKQWKHMLEVALPPNLEAGERDVRCARLRSRMARTLHCAWPPMKKVFPYRSPAGFHCRKHQSWSIHEICTPRRLLEEGALMRHCVTLYGSRCRGGPYAIFSMRLLSEAAQQESFYKTAACTIRVNGAWDIVVEAKGYRNRLPSTVEKLVIRSWAKKNKLCIWRKAFLE